VLEMMSVVGPAECGRDDEGGKDDEHIGDRRV